MPSATKTANYGLNQWQGNEYPKRQDFVDDNAAIDTQMKANADAINAHKADQTVHVTTLACAKSGTVYALTGLTASSGKVRVMFSVPSAYTAGDTVTIDGTAYTLTTTDGSALTAGAWAAGAMIAATADVDGNALHVWPSAPIGSIHAAVLPSATENGGTKGSGIDLDDITQAGIYIFWSDFSSTVHAPPNVYFGDANMIVSADAAGSHAQCAQLLFISAGAYYRKSNYLGTFPSWTKIGEYADYASGTVALTTAGLRNEYFLNQTAPPSTAGSSGTVVNLY